MTGSTVQEFLNRYEEVKLIDQSKNALIEDLLRRVGELEDIYQRTRLDHERETRFNRGVQMREIELVEQISRIKTIMDREPFVIVLLDGDGMIFQDSFLQQGEQGGKDAANQLWAAIRENVTRHLPNVSSPKIITRIYANLKGLADVCYKAGIVEKPSLIEDFARGFNGSRLLFDFVDVGSGKDRADDKIAEIFKLHLYNCHCHQVFLGCSHDNGYARLLEDTLADQERAGHISLIEGVPFEKELASIKSSFRTTKFETIFRESKVVSSQPAWGGTLTHNQASTQSTPLSALSPNQGTNSTLSRAVSSSTNTSSSAATPSTWASMTAAAPGNFTDETLSKPSTPSPPKVERNKYGQRVDRLEFKTIPKDELNRVKKLKLCNLYFLLGDCPNLNCYHTHSHKLTKNERVVLQAVARMTPCHFGTECDDVNCIYGHRCPQSEVGKKDCYWGSNCRFDTAAHGIDTNIVKTTKV